MSSGGCPAETAAPSPGTAARCRLRAPSTGLRAAASAVTVSRSDTHGAATAATSPESGGPARGGREGGERGAKQPGATEPAGDAARRGRRKGAGRLRQSCTNGGSGRATGTTTTTAAPRTAPRRTRAPTWAGRPRPRRAASPRSRSAAAPRRLPRPARRRRSRKPSAAAQAEAEAEAEEGAEASRPPPAGGGLGPHGAAPQPRPRTERGRWSGRRGAARQGARLTVPTSPAGCPYKHCCPSPQVLLPVPTGQAPAAAQKGLLRGPAW